MFHIHCPYCEEMREEDEFHRAGVAHLPRPPDPDACTDREWGEYLFFRDNPRGPIRELWVHAAGCGKYFNISRNTATYEIYASYRIGERPDDDHRPADGHRANARQPDDQQAGGR